MIERANDVGAHTDRSAVLLSICIPTFNRAHTLGRLLSALSEEFQAPKVAQRVEIIVCDNASTDDTESLIEQEVAKGLPITYFRQESNLGFGKNLNKAVALANGQYCWLMGSDDIPAPSALSAVLERMADRPDIMIGSVLTNGRIRQFLEPGEDSIELQTRKDTEAFINRCAEISSLFAFMSALIVRRDYWNKPQLSQDVISHPYTHQLRIFSAIAMSSTRIGVVREPIVVTGDEGNEWDAQVGKHFELDCRTLELISTTIFSRDHGIFRALGGVFRRQYGTSKFIRSRACLNRSHWTKLVPVLENWGYPRSLLRKPIYDGVIFQLYRILKVAKHSLK